jgi:hypothetical protein
VFEASPRTAALCALVLLVCCGFALSQPPIPPDEFPPTVAKVKLTVKVGEQVTVGGPGSDNFLPSTVMRVYVVPHRIWRDGDVLAANAVQSVRLKSDAKGQLPLTQLWKPDKPGMFDIIVDYDGDGRFSYALDAADAVDVRAK